MSLGVDIDDLSNRIRGDLYSVHDYYVHHLDIWRLIQVLASEGREFSSRNLQTGTAVDLAALSSLGDRYITGYLAESVFIHLASLAEDFVFGLLRLWLAAHPGGIPNKEEKSVRLATILEAPDREAILLVVIDRELDGLKYKRPAAWFRYLDDRVRLGCPSDDQIARFAELKATRDVLVHNRGVVNETYRDKAGALARHEPGERMEIPEPYLRSSWTLIVALVDELSAAAVARGR